MSLAIQIFALMLSTQVVLVLVCAKAFLVEDAGLLKTPQDIMPLYLYLMAPEGKAVNGQCIDAQPKK